MTRYAITEREQQGAKAFVLTDAERNAEAVLFPELGNNCAAFITAPDAQGEPIPVFVPPDDVNDLRAVPFHSGNPILFPFPNRVRAGVYTFEGVTYRMDKLLATGWDRGAGQAIHGLVADKAWTVEAQKADENGASVRCSLTLDAFPDILEQYPFPSRISVTYTLRDGVLEMLTEVVNTGMKTLPMGFGIHPWFPIALRPDPPQTYDADERGAALVQVPAAALWDLDHLMPNGHIMPVQETTFDLRNFRALHDQFFDHVFTQIVRRPDGWSEGGLRDPATGLEIFVEADGAFREWVLYAPLNRPVIALEPYTCTTDAVNLVHQGHDAGLITLPPGETWRGVIRFGLRHTS